MEKAKQAVSQFMSKDGKHVTDVDQEHRAAITEEHVRPHRHEEVTTAIDKEVHQHHHHTTVQPIKASERVAEKHTHNAVPITHKTFHHDDDQVTRDTLDRDAAKYRDSSATHETTHSHSAVPVIAGEHVHHHIHEHVQPVIQKDTVVPEVVHTTVPIHETHHAQTIHHDTTVRPARTMEEFEREFGKLRAGGAGAAGAGGVGGAGVVSSSTGAERAEAQKLAEFEGCPDHYNKDFGMAGHSHGLHTGAGAVGVGSLAADKSAKDKAMLRQGMTAEHASDERGLRSDKTTSPSQQHQHQHKGLATAGAVGAGAGAAGLAAEKHHASKDRAAAGTGTGNTNAPTSQRFVNTDPARNQHIQDSGMSDWERNYQFAKNRSAPSQDGAVGGGAGVGEKLTSTTGTAATAGNRSSVPRTAQVGGVGAGGLGDSTATTGKTQEPLASGNKETARPDSGVGMTPGRESTASSGSKASLKDRLNPFKDADGDGKKGIMS